MEPRAHRQRPSGGLRHVSPDQLVIRRRRCGKGFTYLHANGTRVSDEAQVSRIRSLAIPPNYVDVRIADDPRAHIQAVGRDAAGRTQYRYHPDWVQVRERRKLDKLAALSHAITRIRHRVLRCLAMPGAPRCKAVAGVVAVLDLTHIRVGGDEYVHSGRSRGAVTLLKKNVRVEGDHVSLEFWGKGRRRVCCTAHAAALARALEDLSRIPGRRMFQYLDDEGLRHRVTAADVNEFLQEVADAPVAAKDFRTLAATAAAAVRLCAITPDRRKTYRRRQVAEVMRAVAELLGNTPTVARQSYVHSELVTAFSDGRLARLHGQVRGSKRRTRGEALVGAVLAEAAATDTARNTKESIVDEDRSRADSPTGPGSPDS